MSVFKQMPLGGGDSSTKGSSPKSLKRPDTAAALEAAKAERKDRERRERAAMARKISYGCCGCGC